MSLPTVHRPSAPTRLETAVLGLCGVRTASAPLPVVLLDVLDWVTVAVPADSCSVLVRVAGAADLVRASDVVVDALTVDGVNRMHSPLADALTATATTHVGRVHVDPRWPAFGRRAGGAGVRSVVVTGLRLDHRATALVAHWSTASDAFTATDVAGAADFAAHLAPVLANAVAANDLLRRNENLAQALTSRAVIDQAIGIVMSRTGSTAEQAMERMRTISQREHLKVHEVAHRTVRDAVNRTRARRLQSTEPVGATAVSS